MIIDRIQKRCAVIGYKCWLCESETGEGYPTLFGMQCPACGPPMPWGPTAEELATDDKRETDTTVEDELQEYDRG